MQSQIPIYLRCSTTFPCCTRVPRVIPLKIQNLDLQQLRLLDMLPKVNNINMPFYKISKAELT